MAIRIGKQIKKDTKEFADYAIGLTLPLKFDNSTFRQSYKTVDQVKSNIINLLSTMKGERIMQPDFGSGLHSLLFNNINEETEDRVEEAIIDAFSTWIPYVSLEEVDIDMSDRFKDDNKIGVSLKFRIADNTDLEEIAFTITGN